MTKLNLVRYYREAFGTGFAFSLAERGLLKIIYALESLKYETTVNFLGAQDFSITLNRDRLKGGFVIGNILSWGDGDIPFLPLELMLNCCGNLCAEIEDEIIEENLLEKILNISREGLKVYDFFVDMDIGRKNHFLNIYKDNDDKNYLIIHSSLKEAKSDNHRGFGLYFNKSAYLLKFAKRIATPFGELIYLDGNLAHDYFLQYMEYDQISKAKRVGILEELFDDFHIISNETHLGLLDANTANLGCYAPKNTFTLVPITQGPNRRAYLARATSDCRLENRGSIMIVPHGTGICLKHFDELKYLPEPDKFFARINEDRFYTSNVEDIIEGYNDISVALDSPCEKTFEIIHELLPTYEFRF